MKKSDKVLIIIPTFNEIQNIEKLIPDVLKQNPKIDILVVDDNSPDGTATVVKKWAEKSKRVRLIERDRKLGLGTAYVTGFRYALKSGYDLIFEMDADFSHDPRAINDFLKTIKDYDLVIGSRYIEGVNVVNWPLSRLLLSWFANLYTRFITRMPIRDTTSGFKCFRRKVLEAIDLNKIHSDGYAFQIEMHYKVWKKGFRLKEIPIVFVDRNIGVSKMSSGIIREAAVMVWRLRIMGILGKI